MPKWELIMDGEEHHPSERPQFADPTQTRRPQVSGAEAETSRPEPQAHLQPGFRRPKKVWIASLVLALALPAAWMLWPRPVDCATAADKARMFFVEWNAPHVLNEQDMKVVFTREMESTTDPDGSIRRHFLIEGYYIDRQPPPVVSGPYEMRFVVKISAVNGRDWRLDDMYAWPERFYGR